MASLLFEILHCKRRPFATLIHCPCHHSKACVNSRHHHKINGACSCFSHSSHHYVDTSVLRPHRTAMQMLLEAFFGVLYYHIINCKNEKILKAPFRVFQIYTLVELLGTLWRLKYSTVHSRNFNIFPPFVSKPLPYDLVLLEELLIVFIEFLKKFMDSILFLIPPFHQNGAV